MRKIALIALLAAFLQQAAGQRMGAALHSAPQFASGGSALGRHSFAYPIPFFTDGFYSDAFYTSGYSPVPATVIVMQAPPAAEPERTPPPAQPLLIELQGDRYVRISGEEISGAQMIEPDPGLDGKPDAIFRPVAVPKAATVLVFRNGHSEEVSDYTIADGILYARGNFYTDGSWNRKIELSSLNLVETVAANRSRGLKFQLPSAPNEVVVGP
jgi:hypothetical protein